MDRTLRPVSLRTGLSALILLSALSLANPARSQGCSQCREAVGQTPARTQTAYRNAIILMLAAGSIVFAGALLTLKRFR